MDLSPVGALLLTEMLPPAVGGSGVLLENVYRRFTGHRVSVITGTQAAAERRPAVFSEIHHATIDGRLRGVTDLTAVRQHARLMRQIRAEHRRQPIVVHCGRAMPEGVPARLASRGSNGPKYACWIHGEEVASALLSREYTWVMKRVYRGASALIANSAHTAGFLGRLGLETSRVHVVHPGVDAARFTPEIDSDDLRRRFAQPGDTMLLSVGRLQARKGHDLVLRAVRHLTEVGLSVHYVIVGEGEERPRLTELCRRLGLEGDVSFVGPVCDDELPRYYAACDIFVLPNRIAATDFEGFGIVFLEAAASARPVVAGRSGGVPEAVADGESGMLVSGDDPAELTAALRTLIEQPHLRQQIGRSGRDRAVRLFSWDVAARQVERLHDAISAP